MTAIKYLVEFGVSLFDAVLCVYFISRFNHKPISPRKNKLFIPGILVIFVFSIINDLFLSGFNILGTVLFLCLYISYALLIANKRYIRAILSACIFEIVFILLSSLLYLVITFIIKDYDVLIQGSFEILRYVYVIIHKISLFVSLKALLMAFNQESTDDLRFGWCGFVFSFITILGLGSTMYLASISRDKSIQPQIIVITLTFVCANVILYLLIHQMQKYEKNKYELRLLKEKIAFEEARHNDASAVWSKIRKIQHDMNQHLSVILGYIESENLSDCKKYVNQLLPKATGMGTLIRSDNTALDYLINSKLCQIKDTKIIISGSIGDLSDIKDTDLVCLMGNVLDNAMEALSKLHNNSEKVLELLFLRQNSNRIIICKNTIDSSVLNTNPQLKTTKTNTDHTHGYGTKIIAKIVSDYSGMVDYFEEFNMFGVQIILPDPS